MLIKTNQLEENSENIKKTWEGLKSIINNKAQKNQSR